MRNQTALVAMQSAQRACWRLLPLFAPWPAVSLEDLVQQVQIDILRAEYDITKAAFATFAYQVAYRRALDYRDKLIVRGKEEHLDVDVRPVVAPGSEPAETGMRRRPGRGRPWRYPLAVRVDCVRRRLAGESWGSIAQRYGLHRGTARRIAEKSVRKIGKHGETPNK
jgi:hypothetical protein